LIDTNRRSCRHGGAKRVGKERRIGASGREKETERVERDALEMGWGREGGQGA
jgi:hypothetical protein